MSPAQVRGMDRRARGLAAATAAVIVLGASVAGLASRRTSVTFDEVFMIPQGARGAVTGDFSRVYEHPPGMLLAYGAAAHLAGVRLPREYQGAITPPEVARQPGAVVVRPEDTFNYGQEVLFRAGNDPEHIVNASRLVAVGIVAALGAAVALFAWKSSGPLSAFVATALVMLLPDILAHGGIAYNDLPGALFFLLGLWAWDAMIRSPSAPRAAVAGATTGVALGVKFSAIALVPAALAIVVLETMWRGRDAPWLRRLAAALPIAMATGWLVLVIVYQGDWALAQLRAALARNVAHVETGHGAPAFLLGRSSASGFWYFFPVALVLKTPAALHVLAILAVIGYAPRRRWHGELLSSPLRIVGVGALVYLGLLLRANLNIGVRHALPLLPLIAIGIGVGLGRLWETTGRRLRVLIVGLMLAYAGSSLAHYPWFLSYLTEYVPDRRERGHRVMVDSNLDWGHGLMALRDFMREQRIDAVALSYFGSALPEAYGIRYQALPSFLPLLRQPAPGSPPAWVVISATNLRGLYFEDDPFRPFRDVRPDVVIANSLYAYRLR